MSKNSRFFAGFFDSEGVHWIFGCSLGGSYFRNGLAVLGFQVLGGSGFFRGDKE